MRLNACGQTGDVYVSNQDLAARGVIQSSNDTEQGTFARARRTKYADKLSTVDLKTDTA
jgi:hypothetical protein